VCGRETSSWPARSSSQLYLTLPVLVSDVLITHNLCLHIGIACVCVCVCGSCSCSSRGSVLSAGFVQTMKSHYIWKLEFQFQALVESGWCVTIMQAYLCTLTPELATSVVAFTWLWSWRGAQTKPCNSSDDHIAQVSRGRRLCHVCEVILVGLMKALTVNWAGLCMGCFVCFVLYLEEEGCGTLQAGLQSTCKAVLSTVSVLYLWTWHESYV